MQTPAGILTVATPRPLITPLIVSRDLAKLSSSVSKKIQDSQIYFQLFQSQHIIKFTWIFYINQINIDLQSYMIYCEIMIC